MALQIRKKIRTALCFVDNRTVAVPIQKTAWIVLGQPALIQLLEVHIGAIRKGVTCKSGLAGLSWSDNSHNLEFSGLGLHYIQIVTSNPHEFSLRRALQIVN